MKICFAIFQIFCRPLFFIFIWNIYVVYLIYLFNSHLDISKFGTMKDVESTKFIRLTPFKKITHIVSIELRFVFLSNLSNIGLLPMPHPRMQFIQLKFWFTSLAYVDNSLRQKYHLLASKTIYLIILRLWTHFEILISTKYIFSIAINTFFT